MEQKIVVNMRGGAVHKGVTHDFSPKQDFFHVLPAEGGGLPLRVQMDDMKAMFWVRDYLGNRDFVARRDFDGVFSICSRLRTSLGNDLSSVTSATSAATSAPKRATMSS